ncbi:PREDICTED: protein FAM214B [Gekko japonicus]|uniref:Protein FAM214B n=1 Tax=Gekko japonicus TaxID=146911 RepID=A0ABM1JLG1_GEKJA|nr:PREDICTED: protein FAM214B [Gekko japonicus]
MRHINAEAGLPQECSAGASQEEEEEEEEDSRPWCRPHGVVMGCSPPELVCQKVYQVSIFSQLAGCSHPPEQRAPGRQPFKRACPEPQRRGGTRRGAEGEWDAKRGRWEGGEEEEEEGDDAIEDGLVVGELALGGMAQHFSHSGLRVVEHRREGSPSHCAAREADQASAKGGAAQALPPPPPTPCSTLHTTDRAPALRRGRPTDSGPAGRQEENGAQPVERPGSPSFLLDPDLHKLAQHAPRGRCPVARGHPEPGTPPAARGPGARGPGSSEKTPCSSAWLSGGGAGGCPAKRKLLPSAEGTADTGSAGEGLSPVRKKRAPQCPAVPASCRSTDAKGAPFYPGVIDLDALGKKGYSIPKTGTIQVTLFNPNKTVVKMFLVTYNFHDMPANHVTFLRHRIFLVPVGEEEHGSGPALGGLPRRVLCYLMHLRFHSSKSGKIYLHDDIRLLFSRKSIEIDSGIPYELKSFTELPRNPCYSPRT